MNIWNAELSCMGVGYKSKIKIYIRTISADPDEMGCYVPSHVELHCLQKVRFGLRRRIKIRDQF